MLNLKVQKLILVGARLIALLSNPKLFLSEFPFDRTTFVLSKLGGQRSAIVGG